MSYTLWYLEEGITNGQNQQTALNVESQLLELERLIHSIAKRDVSDEQYGKSTVKRTKQKEVKKREKENQRKLKKNKSDRKEKLRRKKKKKKYQNRNLLKKNRDRRKKKKTKWRKKDKKDKRDRKKKKRQRRKEKKRKEDQVEKNESEEQNSKKEELDKKKGNDKEEKKEDDHISRQTCEECTLLLRDYSKLYRGKASVIPRQFKRINNFENLRSSKRNKRGNFVSSYSSLLSALENKSSPKCDGFSISENSTQKQYVTALTTLETCETDIDTNCPRLLTDAENVTIISCNDLSLKFVTSMSDCLNNTKYTTSSAVCDCVKAISQADVDALKQCDITQLSRDQKAEKNKCVKG